MTIMSDSWIIQQCNTDEGMITPYTPDSISRTDGSKHPSFGLSSYGYDLRIGGEFRIMQPCQDPTDETQFIDSRKEMPPNLWKSVKADSLLIQPGECVLGVSMEYLRIPRDILVVCMAKSTFARMFLETTVTPIESSWRGFVTIEMVNKSPRPIRIHAGDGIMQMLFFKGDQPCQISYEDRGGKYQDQPAVPVPPRHL